MRVIATPAAPAPEMTTLRSSSSRSVSRTALSSAASTTTAVPCWSSWKTGMSSRSMRRRSISKQRGAGDVLEVDAAERRREAHDRLDDLVDVGGGEGDRDRVDAAELLEQHGLALHHRHRGGRADVAEAQHGGAVGDDGDGVGDPGVLVGEPRGRRRSPRRRGRRRACRTSRGRRRRATARLRRPPSCRRGAARRWGRPGRGCRVVRRCRWQPSRRRSWGLGQSVHEPIRLEWRLSEPRRRARTGRVRSGCARSSVSHTDRPRSAQAHGARVIHQTGWPAS